MTIPLCPYFGSCGGCTTQHIEYEKQLENKTITIARSLRIQRETIKVITDQEYHYRNRMDFVFAGSKIGIRERGSFYKVVDIEKCVISNPKINDLLTAIRQHFTQINTFDLKTKTGVMRHALIRATSAGDNAISFVLNEDSSKKELMTEKIKDFAPISQANNIQIAFLEAEHDESTSDRFITIKGNEYLNEILCGKTFCFPIQGFFQNNTAMAQKMQEYVRSILLQYSTKQASLLDLYGGVGTFGIINADLFKDVTIIESVSPAIHYANQNITNNQIKNAKALLLDAKSLGRVKLGTPLYVIADPPRTGMDQKAIDQLKSRNPEVIIYISCNLEQLAKELPKFKSYKIKSVALLDLFPQTNHCETIVELVRK